MKKSQLRQIIREEISNIKENKSPYESAFNGPIWNRDGETIDIFISTLEQYIKAAEILKKEGDSDEMNLGSLIQDMVDLFY